MDRQVLSLGSQASSADQQAAEALAILVSLREWSHRWKDKRVCLSLRTDNVAALTTLVKLQPHSNSLGVIARELALDIARSAFAPDEAVHIPGVANKAADHLSRMFAPSAYTALPPYLNLRLQHECTNRDLGWWRSRPR